MYRFSTCSVLLWVLWLSEKLVVSGTINASAPSNVEQCIPTTFSWQGGTAPFTLLFNTTSETPKDSPIVTVDSITVPVMMALQFGNIYELSYTTPVYFFNGSTASFQVTDSQNQTSNVVFFIIISGVTSACEVGFYPGTSVWLGPEEDNPYTRSLQIDNPNSAPDACDPEFFIGWGLSGGIGAPPYILTVQTTGLSILQAMTFGNFTGQLPYIRIAFPSGVQVIFGVQDFHGLQSFTAPITIEPSLKPSNSCVISNLTTVNLSHPTPSTTLPFPSLYPLGTPHHSSKPRTLGLAVGIPIGVIFLGSLLAISRAFHRQKQRRGMAQVYWGARFATESRILGPRERSQAAEATVRMVVTPAAVVPSGLKT